MLLASALASLAFVLRPDRILDEVAGLRSRTPPVTLEVTVSRAGEDASVRARVDLHPTGGWRITDDRGARWIGSGPSVRQASSSDPPEGLAHSWVLWVGDREALGRYLSELGIDLSRSELGRCGDADCFVLGGRSGAAQLWIDKDLFEVRRLRTRRGRAFEFEGYGEGIGGARVPARIRVLDSLGPIAEVEIAGVEAAPSLGTSPDLVPAGPARRP